MNPKLGYLTSKVIELSKLIADSQNSAIGGTVIFLGTVREFNSENLKLSQLYYEAYETMAEEIFCDIEAETRRKWKIERLTAVHRIGSVNVGEVSVVIIVSSEHRKEAFDSCKYIIDNVKTRVPIWKMEISEAGKKWLGGTLILPTEK